MYKRLYFYAAEPDWMTLLAHMKSLGLFVFDDFGTIDTEMNFADIRDDEGTRYISLKHPNNVRRDNDGKSFTSATYDVLWWRRGYVYKNYLIGNQIEQTLPRFRKPRPTRLDLREFEDAKELRKIWNALRRWMKNNWTDHYNNGSLFAPEALRLLLDENYLSQSYDPDWVPTEHNIYVGEE